MFPIVKYNSLTWLSMLARVAFETLAGLGQGNYEHAQVRLLLINSSEAALVVAAVSTFRDEIVDAQGYLKKMRDANGYI